MRSLSLLLCISAAVGYVVYELGYSFYAGSVAALLIQLLVFNVFKFIRNALLTVKLKELQIEELQSFERQGVELNCAYCKEPVFSPIRLDQQNSFKCPACDKTNAVYINMTVAQETDSINMESLTTQLLIDDEERAKDAIRSSGESDE